MQSALHAMAKPPTQASALPPLQNLPSWSRSGLQRKKEPRSINRDRLEPIGSKAGLAETAGSFQENESNQKSLSSSSVVGRIVSAPLSGHELDSRERVVHLEKSLEFLQEQHSLTLGSLHREIERLKSENKELNFKLVMAKTGINIAKAVSPVQQDYETALTVDDTNSRDRTSEQEKQQKKQVVSQVKERKSVSKNACKVTTLPQQKIIVEERRSAHRQFSGKKMTKPTPPSSAKGSSSAKSRNSAKVKLKSKTSVALEKQITTDSSNNHGVSSTKLHLHHHLPAARRNGPVLMVTFSGDSKIQVHIPSEEGPRSPTLSECNAIIKQQQETNLKQAQELSKLKMDLKDAKYAQNLPPDAYLMTKPYIAEASRPVRETVRTEYRPLPKLNPHHAPRLTNRARLGQDSVSLPALRPNLNPTVAERRKRQQAVLRGRSTTDKRDY